MAKRLPKRDQIAEIKERILDLESQLALAEGSIIKLETTKALSGGRSYSQKLADHGKWLLRLDAELDAIKSKLNMP